jgi:hypothetical protein
MSAGWPRLTNPKYSWQFGSDITNESLAVTGRLEKVRVNLKENGWKGILLEFKVSWL